MKKREPLVIKFDNNDPSLILPTRPVMLVLALNLILPGIYPMLWFFRRFSAVENRISLRERPRAGFLFLYGFSSIIWYFEAVYVLLHSPSPDMLLTWRIMLPFAIAWTLGRGLLFWLRWVMRDFLTNGAFRTHVVMSWLLLWILGTTYLQIHINWVNKYLLVVKAKGIPSRRIMNEKNVLDKMYTIFIKRDEE